MNHFFYRAMGTGVLLRGGLITAIYNKALKLSTRARHIHPNGKLVNHISTDVSRIDFACQFFHASWTAPIQLIICLIILLVNLGPSALAGFAVFFIVIPIQAKLMGLLLRFRRKTMVFTDKRAKLLQELLSSIKIIKFFAWEDPYLAKIHKVRNSETRRVSLESGFIRRVLMDSTGPSVLLSFSEQESSPSEYRCLSLPASSHSSSTGSIIHSTPRPYSLR